jgi:DNA-binding response OmpR family regulator
MRILLVEDDPGIAAELSLRWTRQGWDTMPAPTLLQAEAALAARPDVVVLDLGLPDGDGLDWLQRLRQRDAKLPVIVLTARDRVADRVRGLKGGADDYLVKPFAPEELDARIEVLVRRSQRDGSEAAHFADITWLPHEGSVMVGNRPLELSPREFEVLGLLLARAPRLLPKRSLIDALAEKNLDVGDSAAEVYVSRLRRKLVGSGASIKTLRGFGYQLVMTPPDGGGRRNV